jgi:hypothetical protein
VLVTSWVGVRAKGSAAVDVSFARFSRVFSIASCKLAWFIYVLLWKRVASQRNGFASLEHLFWIELEFVPHLLRERSFSTLLIVRI